MLRSLDSKTQRLPDVDRLYQLAIEEGRFYVQVMDVSVLRYY